jgi:hypothetical protein
MSAELLVDPRPQADCARVGWIQDFRIAQRSPKFEQHVRQMVAEGTTGIPPSAHRDALD